MKVYSRGYCKKHYEEARRHDEFSNELINVDYEIYPFGYADNNRPEWHKKNK